VHGAECIVLFLNNSEYQAQSTKPKAPSTNHKAQSTMRIQYCSDLHLELEKNSKTFVITLKTNIHGFKRGDILTCRKTSKPIPGKIAILERDDCGKWPMPYDEAGPEIKAGARLVGQALCLCRDLDGEAQR